MTTMTLEAPTKTAPELLSEVAALGRERVEREKQLKAKQNMRQAVALPASRGDADSITQVRKLSDEIEQLKWRIEIIDLAIVEAGEQAKGWEQAETDKRRQAIMAERDKVVAEASALYPEIGAVTSHLVSLLNVIDEKARAVFVLTENYYLDTDQEELLQTMPNAVERKLRRNVTWFLQNKLFGTYLRREWDMSRSYLRQYEKQELDQLFVVPGNALTVGDEERNE